MYQPPTKPFLERYSGESVDQLLALEDTYRIDSLVLAFEWGIMIRAERDGYETLTTAEMTVLAIEALEAQVNNGGYSQFFFNTTNQYISVIVPALLRIGCVKVAAITEEAIAALGTPPLSDSQIQHAVCDYTDAAARTLSDCSNRFFDYPEPIEHMLFAFIKENKSEIRL